MVTYDLLSADTSWGRDEEGDGSFKLFTSPTPGLPNTRAGMTAMDTRMCLANTSGLYVAEVMTGNKRRTQTERNYYYDYIEIYNMSGQAVNLTERIGLCNNIKKPRKWQFPDITIENNSYLVIYCDTTQTSKDGVYYFTNYNLKKSGETVCLSTPAGRFWIRWSSPSFTTIPPTGARSGRRGCYLFHPHAGRGERTGLYRLCRAADLQRGGRPVHAAADGRKRGHDQRSGGQHRPLYARQHRPERILPDLHRADRDRNQHGIRARTYRDGVEASQIISETYLISVYHTMPVVCLTTDPDNLTNEEYGAFAYGPNVDTSKPTPWIKIATYGQKNWLPAWLEYSDENGQLQLSQGVRFRVMGQYSLDMPQKSLFIKADGQFGKGEFDYALFDDRPFTTYKSFVLRNGGQDGLFTRVMDGLEARLIDQAESTLATQAWKPVIVYINGQYWGHYNMRERAGVDMVAQHEGWLKSKDIDLLQSDGPSSSQVKQGSNADYKALYNKVKDARI